MKHFLPRLFLAMLGTALLVGCGSPGVPRPPSLDLPEPVSDLRAVRKGDRVYLAWTVPTVTTDQESVRHLGATRVCRSLAGTTNECTNPVAEVSAAQVSKTRSAAHQPAQSPARVQATYTDQLPPTVLSDNPSAQVFYAVSVQNEKGRSAGLSKTAPVPAVVALSPPPDLASQVTADGVILSWTGIPHPPGTAGLRRIYRVYRREVGATADTVAGELPLGTLRSYLLLDHSFEWEKTYLYRATVVTLIHREGKAVSFEGDDTPAVKVFAHDVFPPAVPSGLQAAFSGVERQPFIDLIWAPDTDADLAGYNIYRREQGGEPVKVNSQPVKAPAFRDTNVVTGHGYLYSVSAVDVRGNESARSEEASETVP